jgi:hypothetical protein
LGRRPAGRPSLVNDLLWLESGPLVLIPVFSRPVNALNLLIQRRSKMPKTKLEIIRPFLAVNSLPDADLLPLLISAHDGVFGNPAVLSNTIAFI